MRAKSPHFTAVLLAVQCGLWVAVAPVMSQLHQAVADHRHVYCLEHARVEDEGRREAPAGFAAGAAYRNQAQRAFGVACVPACGDSALDCVFSNFSAYAFFQASARAAQILRSELLAVHPLRDVNFQVASALESAPKTSPPTVG